MKKDYIFGIGILCIIILIIYLTKDKVIQTVQTVGVIISDKIKAAYDKMVAAAAKEGVTIYANSGLRTFDKQLALRKQNVIDKSKINDLNYLKTAPSTSFKPVTAIPGTSNHETGLAVDLNTADEKAYKWLVKNALKFGFVRTVKSERWHWEFRPSALMFTYVPQTDPTWDKLA